MKPSPDFDFANNKLYARQKFKDFSNADIDILCLYFKFEDVFIFPADLDFLEV